MLRSNDVKQVRDAFARLSKGIKITEFSESNTIKIETDFTLENGSPIAFYAYLVPPSKKIYFTDAGRVYKNLSLTGQKLQDSVIQTLIESYGLVLLDDNSIIDQQDAPLHERMTNLIQVQIGIDTMVRTWNAYASKIEVEEEEPEDDIL